MSEEKKQPETAAEPTAEAQAGQAEQTEETTSAEQAAPEVDAAAEAPAPEPKEPDKKNKKDKKDGGKKNHEIDIMEARAAAAEKKEKEAREQLLRTAAEYDNFRKRSARESDQKFNDGVSYAVTQIIPILDTLEMAANAPCTDENFKKGVAMTLDKAAKALETMKITEIEAEGKPFDPNLMNAVSQVPAPEGTESGSVVTVYQKGYVLDGKVVRHATVTVAE